jgi:hypothetical protein
MTKPGSDTRIEHEVVGPEDRLVIMVGSYGSGKTEVCVNLAVELARSGRKVQIADLDIVNPYFRCREAKQLMERHGVRVVVPPGAQAFADLPIVLPEIRGMINPPDGTLTIFDVGGDDVGARVLASLRTSIMVYELWQVVNSKRPFTDTLEGCLAMQHAVEKSSRLKITGVVANSHLIDQTTPSVVSEGWRLAQSVAAHSEIPVRCVAMMRELAESPQLETIGVPKLRMQRHMLPPWIQAGAELGAGSTPAAPPVPIGIPRYERGTDG